MSISRIATEWLPTRTLAEIDADGYAQADIDELFSVPPTDSVHVGLKLLRAALDGAEASRPGTVAILVVPLPSSDELVLRAPDFAEVASAAGSTGRGLRWSVSTCWSLGCWPCMNRPRSTGVTSTLTMRWGRGRPSTSAPGERGLRLSVGGSSRTPSTSGRRRTVAHLGWPKGPGPTLGGDIPRHPF